MKTVVFYTAKAKLPHIFWFNPGKRVKNNWKKEYGDIPWKIKEKYNDFLTKNKIGIGPFGWHYGSDPIDEDIRGPPPSQISTKKKEKGSQEARGC